MEFLAKLCGYRPKKQTINLGKLEYRFHLYNGEVIKKTIQGSYHDLGQFSYVLRAKDVADSLKNEFVKANKLQVGFNYLLDTREVKKIEFDPEEKYEITIEE